jgi:hypothetical protein
MIQTFKVALYTIITTSSLLLLFKSSDIVYDILWLFSSNGTKFINAIETLISQQKNSGDDTLSVADYTRFSNLYKRPSSLSEYPSANVLLGMPLLSSSNAKRIFAKWVYRWPNLMALQSVCILMLISLNILTDAQHGIFISSSLWLLPAMVILLYGLIIEILFSIISRIKAGYFANTFITSVSLNGVDITLIQPPDLSKRNIIKAFITITASLVVISILSTTALYSISHTLGLNELPFSGIGLSWQTPLMCMYLSICTLGTISANIFPKEPIAYFAVAFQVIVNIAILTLLINVVSLSLSHE